MTALLLLLVPFAHAGQDAGGRPFPPEPAAIDRAIDDGVESLRRAYEDEVGARGYGAQRAARDPSVLRAGERALLAYALLEGGADADDEFVRRILAGLSFEPIEHTYDAACTLLLLEQHDARANREWIEELARLLLSWQVDGAWGYPVGEDLSNTQYAALGLWAAARAGVEVPARAWAELARAVEGHRRHDGGFAYHVSGGGSTGSMTAAGVGTLALCEMELARLGALEPEPARALRASRDGALDWVERRFRPDANPGADAWTFYWLYGVERMAAFAGLPRLGERDWYAEGASWLLATQAEDGAWQGRVETCFAILFLSRAALASLEPRSGPEEYAASHASSPEAAARIEARFSGDRVAFRLVGFSRRAVAGVERLGERGAGPRVLRVEYLVDGSVAAVALGDARGPARTATFPATARLPAGRHRVRARVVVLDPLGAQEDEGASSSTHLLWSGEVPLDVPEGLDAVPTEGSFADTNLLTRPGAFPQVRSSTTFPGFAFLPGVEFDASRAVDGKARRPWLARAGDDRPTLEISLRRPVRAEGVRLHPARLAGYPMDELGRPLEVEVEVDGRPAGSVVMPPDPTLAAILSFGETLSLKHLRLRILSRVAGRRTEAVGLGEVELLGEAAR